MNNWRKQIILCSMLLLVLFGCTRKNVKDATVVAVDFMNAYFNSEYEKAATFCSPEFGDKILEARELFAAQKEGVQQEMKKISQNVTTRVINVDSEKKDSIIFSVELIVPDVEEGNRTSLITVAKDSDEWKVVNLN